MLKFLKNGIRNKRRKEELFMKMLIVVMLVMSSIAFASEKENQKDQPPAQNGMTLEDAYAIIDMASAEFKGTLVDHQRIRAASKTLQEKCINHKKLKE